MNEQLKYCSDSKREWIKTKIKVFRRFIKESAILETPELSTVGEDTGCDAHIIEDCKDPFIVLVEFDEETNKVIYLAPFSSRLNAINVLKLMLERKDA